LAVSSASGPVFMFCAPRLIFGGTVGVGSRFHVLRSRTRFWRCGGRRLLFSCFALPDSFSAVPRPPSPVFMFYAPVLVFGGIEGVGYRFHILRPGHVFGDAEGVGSYFHILRSQTCFRLYRGRRLSFSCSARPNSFSTVPRALDPRLIFGSVEGVGSCFQVLRTRTRFR
jgi:hypothetical protein